MTAAADVDRRFAGVARALRDGIIEHYRARGETLDTPAGHLTLDTNTILAARRCRLLLRIVERRGGPCDLHGLRAADLGCGFGSLSLYLALAGATVMGVDPNLQRAAAAEAVAERMRLPVTFQRGWMEDLTLPDGAYDLVVLNNTLCYLVDRRDRRQALDHVLRVMRPGAWAVLRNPALLSPTDPFTHLPVVHQLPLGVSRRLLPGRRAPVRLKTAASVSLELRRAGLKSVHRERIDQPWWRPSRYQHHTARKPER